MERDIIKLYQRSGANKEYSQAFFAIRLKMTSAEYSEYPHTSGTALVLDSGTITTDGNLFYTATQIGKIANNPFVVYQWTSAANSDYNDLINYSNSKDIYLTNTYDVNILSSATTRCYFDVSTTDNFSTLICSDVYTTANSITGSNYTSIFFNKKTYSSNYHYREFYFPVIIIVDDSTVYLHSIHVTVRNASSTPLNLISTVSLSTVSTVSGSTIAGYLINADPIILHSDPYTEGGTSTTGGGTGTFDLSSDAIDFPSLPTLSAVSTGLVSLYTPSLAQLNSLATYMWNSSVTDADYWKKLIANPIDLIIGLSIVPVTVPPGSAQNIKVGLIDTGISMTRAASQFVEVDCGSLTISEFWGSALDYSPYRKHSIYLPFIGTRTISTDDIMGKTVQVKYHVDILSGACVAMVKCGDAVLYQYAGSCAISVPLTGQTFTDMIISTLQLASGAAGAIAAGSMGLAGGAAAAAAVGGGAAIANGVMASKPHIERAGGVSGAAGQLGVMTPYLIGEIPRQSVPEDYNTFVGYPSNIKSLLSDLSGFTSVESIHLQNIPCTSAELAEIERLLKEGVIL